jgi:hypothetical protein
LKMHCQSMLSITMLLFIIFIYLFLNFVP